MRCVAIAISLALLSGLAGTGCDVQVGGLLANIDVQFNDLVDRIQVHDPRTIVLPAPIVDRGDAVVIEDGVEVIVSIEDQLVIQDLPNLTLLGIENLTGFDMYLSYTADGVDQEVFVFDGETLLLLYPCLDAVQLWSEEDYDEFGNFVQSFDLEADYFNPEDFYCGDALIITLDAFAVTASIEVIVLSR
jgi:hypothetical protein